VKRAFPQLKRFHQTGALLKRIINPVIMDAPRLVPKVLADALVGLLEAPVSGN
jgi:hypothetical protein